MFSRTLQINNRSGLHARPASMFAETAGRFNSEIRVVAGGQDVDGRSVLGLMLLEAVAGVEITIKAQGDDEIAAVSSLAGLVERGFEE